MAAAECHKKRHVVFAHRYSQKVIIKLPIDKQVHTIHICRDALLLWSGMQTLLYVAALTVSRPCVIAVLSSRAVTSTSPFCACAGIMNSIPRCLRCRREFPMWDTDGYCSIYTRAMRGEYVLKERERQEREHRKREREKQ